MEKHTSNEPRTFTANLFIKQLQKSAFRILIVQIVIGMLLFIVGFYFMTYTVNESNAENNIEMLKEIYLQLYNQSIDFLNEERTVEAFEKKLTDASSQEFDYIFNRLNTKSIIKNEYILTDAEGKLVHSSFPESELSNYLLDYNRAICYNVKNMDLREIYVATYFDTGNYSDYMFVRPVFQHNESIGYISLFIIGSDWNYYLSDANYDGVIVDSRQNVIYRSKVGLANQSGKFKPQSGPICTYNEERYWMKKETLPRQDVTIYSLVYYPKNNAVYIGLIVIVIMGILWFCLAQWMSRTMARYNASRVSHLVKEIRQIQNGDHMHRIHMNTNDEFDEIAHRINRMLDSVRELILLNANLEIGQLEAQMNPHFLYNTLEIIRNLVLYDSERAELLIEKLVHILRYSVNRTYRDVYLREDMDYIQDYLYIQQIRFGERFCCSIELDETCMDCMVPKLLLQPIIENSIKYGFKEKTAIHIRIHGQVEGNVLQIEVQDDGSGMPQKEAIKLQESMGNETNQRERLGLHNIARRLRLQYGENSGLQIQNYEGQGFKVILWIEQKQKGEKHV